MWVRSLNFAYKRCPALNPSVVVAAVSVCSLSGCACLVGSTSAAYQPGAEVPFAQTSVQQTSAGSQGAQKIVAPAPVAVPRHLLRRLKAPECRIGGIQKPASESNDAGGDADPDLLKIAQLQLERDCYRKAEKLARGRLRKIQNSVD